MTHVEPDNEQSGAERHEGSKEGKLADPLKPFHSENVDQCG
jgi:hypothetical protein